MTGASLKIARSPTIGDRVIDRDGSVGIVEEIEGYGEPFLLAGYRHLTPDNEPSVLVSYCNIEYLCVVSEDVKPAPIEDVVREQYRRFYEGLERAIREFMEDDDDRPE